MEFSLKRYVFIIGFFLAIPVLGVTFKKGPPNQITQHNYRNGESVKYLFEDTESTFKSNFLANVGFIPGDQTKYEELEIYLSIRSDLSNGQLQRTLTFEKATYFSDVPSSFNSNEAQSLSKLIPNFPLHFHYQYLTDAQAVTDVVGKAYSPFLGNQVGLFVYFKALDVHTIQSVVDNIPTTMSPGDFIQKPAKDIQIQGGTFHNAATSIHYQRIENFGGLRCAYLKATTMGNKYSYTSSDGKTLDIYTSYQYTFYVPLEGKYQGLLLHGDLQETVTEPDGTIDQRQFSMALRQ